jgi:predicted nucleic acid-binding Zn ribbon protein
VNYEPPARLGDSLNRFLRYLGAPPAQALSTLHDRWPEVVGPMLAERSRPVEVLDGVLIIACEDASWASQLSWMDAQIKQRCSQLFDGLSVARVTVRVDR